MLNTTKLSRTIIIVCMHVAMYVYMLFFLFNLCILFADTKLFG